MDPCAVATEGRFNIRSYCAVSISIPRKATFDKGLTFNVPIELHRKLMDTLEMVIHWFYDPGKKDLFYLDEKDNPHFNPDYRNLRYSVKNKRNNTRIEFAPSEVEVDGKIVEGVVVFINYTDNLTMLPLSELEEIFAVLSSFSYQAEISALSQIYTMSLITKRIVSPDEFSAHTRFEAFGNTNIQPSSNPFKR